MKVKKTLTGPSQGDRALLGDSEYIFFEILAIRAWNPPARQHSRFCPIRLNWLWCLAGGFHAQFSRISKNIYSESPNNALSCYKSPIRGLYLFIRFLLSLLSFVFFHSGCFEKTLQNRHKAKYSPPRCLSVPSTLWTVRVLRGPGTTALTHNLYRAASTGFLWRGQNRLF